MILDALVGSRRHQTALGSGRHPALCPDADVKVSRRVLLRLAEGEELT